jgi:hypothetical protein
MRLMVSQFGRRISLANVPAWVQPIYPVQRNDVAKT